MKFDTKIILQTAPDEMHNLYGQAEYAELITGLKGRLGELRVAYQVAADVD